ncbi:iron-siderophore ABC transporter substrate-binding protein [Curtobacterium ammoniigenes]|uniref:iron-siderophore ABC transporter substrate-binding protein n=1 Tax=Curtobacterium ammoniigenes TaxID=395387 RepID=UPI00082C1A50|nr:iron-siderophore ABC transporter substrate-binding protein [Curtobacterium ammoniigenes]
MIRFPLRRLLAGVSVALAAAVALAGCAPSSSSANRTTDAAPSAGFPTSITTAFGTTTIPSKPERVVALGWGDAEVALELGVQPIGASDWLGFGGDGVGPWLKDAYRTRPTIVGTLEPNYEQIVRLRPDVILDVRSSGDAGRYQKLSAIAPTVAIPPKGANYRTTSEQQVTMIAKALGREQRGAALLASVSSAFDAARAAHPEFADTSAVIGSYSSQGFGAYATGDARVSFMKRLGFTQPRAVDQAAGNGFSVALSEENLGLLSADLTVILPIFTSAAKAEADPLFQRVPSVAEGHALVVDDARLADAFSIGTPAATIWALDRLPSQFANAL